MSEPILLLLDDFSGHWTKEVVDYAKEINVTLMKVPPNATSVSQPVDATWNGPLKVRLRNMWIRHLREQLRTRRPDVAFKLKAPNRSELCQRINLTWGDVSEATIRAGFRKCGLVGQWDDNEDATEATTESYENTDDIVNEVLRSGLLDKKKGSFSLDDDFDDMFRAVAEINEQQ